MEEIFKNTILDVLFDLRAKKFETQFVKETGKEKIENFLKQEETTKKLITQSVEDEVTRKQILKQCEEILLEETNYWNNAYYKLGIIDGVKFISEVKKMYNL